MLSHTSLPGERGLSQGKSWGCSSGGAFPTPRAQIQPNHAAFQRVSSLQANAASQLNEGSGHPHAAQKRDRHPLGSFPEDCFKPPKYLLPLSGRQRGFATRCPWGNSTISQQGGVGSSLHPEAEQNKESTDPNLFLPTEGLCLMTWLRVTKQDI